MAAAGSRQRGDGPSSSTISPGYDFVPSDGKSTGIQILGCGLHGSASSLLDPPDLPCGVLLK